MPQVSCGRSDFRLAYSASATTAAALGIRVNDPVNPISRLHDIKGLSPLNERGDGIAMNASMHECVVVHLSKNESFFGADRAIGHGQGYVFVH